MNVAKLAAETLGTLVLTVLADRLPVTLRLVVMAETMIAIMGLAAGTVAALNRGKTGPYVLVLDEATSALDVSVQEQVLEAVDEIGANAASRCCSSATTSPAYARSTRRPWSSPQ